MSLRTQRALQALILMALGVFFLEKIWAGTLFWYINQRFMFLAAGAGLACLALAQSVWGARRAAERAADPPLATLSGWSLFITAVPLLLGLFIPARPLGSSAIANKGINTSASLSPASAEVTLAIAPAQRTILDWVRVFNYAVDPTAYNRQPADVVGFVYHDTRLPKGQFLVGRFTLNCCVADAMAIGVAVAWPETTPLPDNSWVRVRGSVQAATFNGQTMPLILAETVEQVVEPNEPYLYP